MIKLQNNFTTPKQSKRLLELGVPADSADCVYTTWKNDTPSITYLFDHEFSSLASDPDIQVSIKDGFMNITPCWSVGRLIEIYNECVNDDKEEITIPKEHIVLQRVLILFFAALQYKWLDFSKLEE